MRNAIRLIVGMTLFAVALLGSSRGLKGKPVGEWVDATIYLAMLCFFGSRVFLALPWQVGRSGSTPA